ncbi:hypothetical protein, partial [Salmonella enterica]|uniref:hypothetical protein n=1 Tax=Salmonella enterica TaxID=28901 RepID=UPI0032B35315
SIFIRAYEQVLANPHFLPNFGYGNRGFEGLLRLQLLAAAAFTATIHLLESTAISLEVDREQTETALANLITSAGVSYTPRTRSEAIRQHSAR